MTKAFTLTSLILFGLLSFYTHAKDSAKNEALPSQSGVGTVDRFTTHGREVYRFVPADKSLRMVKFVPGQLGYKKNKLPVEYETLLATALKEKKNIFLECLYFDHGVGKTAIGKKIINLKLEDSK